MMEHVIVMKAEESWRSNSLLYSSNEQLLPHIAFQIDVLNKKLDEKESNQPRMISSMDSWF